MKANNQIIQTIRIIKTIDEIKQLMDAETWFTAKEALETFSDKINVVGSNSVEAVAKLMNDAGIETLYKSK
jgi:ATP-dependent protease ClpP protease subunit